MIKSIVKDILFLGQKSEPATQADMAVVDDLLDTLKANAEHCVGKSKGNQKGRFILVSEFRVMK